RAFDASGATGNAGLQQLFAGKVRRAYDVASEAGAVRDRYGRNTFGQSCLLARRLVEHGVRLVTVNMFDTVFDNVTWDCHADGARRGGQVVGASDRHAAEPRQRPVSPAEVAATVYRALGVDFATQLPLPDGRHMPLVDAAPISELF